jgi:hypothetical protein
MDAFEQLLGVKLPLHLGRFLPLLLLPPIHKLAWGRGGGTLLLLLLHCLIYYLSNWRPQEVNLGLSLGPPLIPE